MYPAGIYQLKISNENTRTSSATGIVLVSLFLTLNIFHTLL